MDTVDSEIGLYQYWHILKRRWFLSLLVFISTLSTSVLWGVSQTPLYEAEGKLLFKGKDSTSALIGLGDELGQLESLDRAENPIETEIGIMRTVPIIQKTIESVDFSNKNGVLLNVRQFLGNLDISHESGTDILKVAYKSSEPEEAEQAVNALMQVYVSEHLLANRAEASAARVFIEQQLPTAEDSVKQAEAALRRFKEKNEVIALETEAINTVDSLQALQSSLTDVTSQLADAEAQFDTLQSQLGVTPEKALVVATISQADNIQRTLSEYQEVQLKLTAERVRFHDKHPVVNDLRQEEENLSALLRDQIQNIIGSKSFLLDADTADFDLQVSDVEVDLINDYIRLNARLKGLAEKSLVLQQTEGFYRERARFLPELEQIQAELERQLKASQSTYLLLLERLQEVRLAENQNVGNAQIIQNAEILNDPVIPNAKLYFVTGGILGLLLALAIALLLEAMDRSVKTVDEVRATFDMPVLGIIPRMPQDWHNSNTPDSLINASHPVLVIPSEMPSVSSEAFQMLGNNLKFLDSDYPPQVVVVTSSVSQEGKSTVSANLAASLAQTGKRVLLIDANLTSPTQHWVWNIANLQGLSNVLVGQFDMEEAISTVLPQLDVFSAGVTPPNPAALLDSQRMADLLQTFRLQYDYVILDAPALTNGAAASILGKMADGILLVVRPRVADTTSIKYVKTLMERSQQRILGLVVNSPVMQYEPYGQYLSDEYASQTKQQEVTHLESV